MVTLLDCIERIPSILEDILEKREERLAPLTEYLGEMIKKLDEVVFIGSGTSNTAALTSQIFVEKAGGLRVRVCYPNDFEGEGHVWNPNALHVFTSQTGTSKVTADIQRKLLAEGCYCVSITEAEETPLAKESAAHIVMGCGKEEYGMRTIGYCASILTHMLMGMQLGLIRGHLTKEQYDAYLSQAAQVPDSRRAITKQAAEWFQINKRQIMRSTCVIFTGSGSLYGVSLEGAVKFWEMPQVISAGYELEEGMHGPNYGYNSNHCVVIFNDGIRDVEKSLSLARFMKEVHHNGLVAGGTVVDDKDLLLDIKSGDFNCLEVCAVPQIMAYYLTVDGGRDLTKPNDHSVMNRYFMTHQEKH
jgi:glucoselysine-6-phosphate deglycase